VLQVRWLRTAVVLAATALLMASSCSWHIGTPIPQGVPPPPGDPVPNIDTHAPGRPADQLHQWAAVRAPVLGIRLRGEGRGSGEPELSLGLDDPGRNRHGGKP
jgi:hypothetical protein